MTKIILRLVFSLFLICCCSQVRSCDCPVKPILDSAVVGSSCIFYGTVFSKEKIIYRDNLDGTYKELDSLESVNEPIILGFYRVTFIQCKIYKGDSKKRKIVVMTEIPRNACGYNFEIGKKYIVYSNGNSSLNQELYTNSCSRTMLFNRNENCDLLKFLKKTRKKRNSQRKE